MVLQWEPDLFHHLPHPSCPPGHCLLACLRCTHHSLVCLYHQTKVEGTQVEAFQKLEACYVHCWGLLYGVTKSLLVHALEHWVMINVQWKPTVCCINLYPTIYCTYVCIVEWAKYTSVLREPISHCMQHHPLSLPCGWRMVQSDCGYPDLYSMFGQTHAESTTQIRHFQELVLCNYQQCVLCLFVRCLFIYVWKLLLFLWCVVVDMAS